MVLCFVTFRVKHRYAKQTYHSKSIFKENILSSLLRCDTTPHEWGTH